MQEETELFKLSNTEKVQLPLGYRKIYRRRLPPLHVENRLMFYNKKYEFNTKQVPQSNKPISKILK